MADLVLNASFNDNVTPNLKKLNKELTRISKKFRMLTKQIRNATRSVKKITTGVDKKIRTSTIAVQRNTVAWERQAKAVKAASRANSRYRSPKEGKGGPARGGPGFGQVVGGAFVGGAALMATQQALNSITGLVGQITANVTSFEGDVIGLRATLQTMGGLEWDMTGTEAKKMMKDLTQVAATLPGSTKDYLTIMSQTIDDQITNMGSLQDVRKDLQRGERSFTALFGLAATQAGLRPEIAAMDINQLRINPRSVRNVQVINRNPVLMAKYLEELDSGKNWFQALSAALEKSITPEQIEEMRNTFDAQVEGFTTAVMDAQSGLFGGAREVMVNGEKTSFANAMKDLFRSMNAALQSFVATGIDPMVFVIKGITWLAGVMTDVANALEGIKGKGLTALPEAIGNFFAGFANDLGAAAQQLPYAEIFQGIDTFFATLFSNLDYGAIGGALLAPIKGFFTSLSGAVIGGLMAAQMGILGPILGGLKTAIMLAFGPLSSILIPLVAILGTIVVLGGGLENTFRQIGEVFAEVGRATWGAVKPLIDMFGQMLMFLYESNPLLQELVSQFRGMFTTIWDFLKKFDMLRAILVPVTATLQLIEFAAQSLAKVFADTGVWMAQNFNKAQLAEAKAAAEKQNKAFSEMKARHDVYNASIRYGGVTPYINKLREDLKSKQAALAGASGDQAKQLKADIAYLTRAIQAGEAMGAAAAQPSKAAAEETSETMSDIQEQSKVIAENDENQVEAITENTAVTQEQTQQLEENKDTTMAGLKQVTESLGLTTTATQTLAKTIIDGMNKMGSHIFKASIQNTPLPAVVMNMSGLGALGGPGAGIGGSAIAASGEGLAMGHKIMSDLMAAGYSKEVAAGIAGNLMHESDQFRADTEYGGGGGRGWAQWTGSRRKEFEAYAASRGLSPTSYAANMGFLLQDLKGPHWTGGGLSGLRQQGSAQGASRYFTDYFERPGVPHYGAREGFANQLYQSYGARKMSFNPNSLVNPEDNAVSSNSTVINANVSAADVDPAAMTEAMSRQLLAVNDKAQASQMNMS